MFKKLGDRDKQSQASESDCEVYPSKNTLDKINESDTNYQAHRDTLAPCNPFSIVPNAQYTDVQNQ